MPHTRPLRARLESYIRDGSNLGAEWIEHEFTWPAKLLEIAGLAVFQGFQWACVHSQTDRAILGLRLQEGAMSFAPMAMNLSGVTICSIRNAVVDPRHAHLPRYVVAELADSRSFGLSVFAFRAPVFWHFVEQRILRREQVTADGMPRTRTLKPRF